MKNNSHEFGKEAENKAREYLEQQNYKILAQNYFAGKAEIDLVSILENILVIVEVKARAANCIRLPEESVSKNKKELLIKASHHFVEKNNIEADVRFDIISIIKTKEHKWKIKHVKDAFNALDI